jgi:type I restriction enzyme S subunit
MSRAKTWERVALGSVCDLNPPKSEVTGISKNESVSFVPMQEIAENQKEMNVASSRPFSEVATGSYTYFRNGDVLLAKVTPCFENGKAGIANDLINGIGFGSSELHTLRASDRISSDFIYRIVTSPHFRAYATPRMTGTGGLRRVPASAIASYEIPLPPLPEQKRIAAILDSADAIRTKRKAAIAMLDQLAQSVFLEMFGDPVKNEKGWESGTIRDLAISVNYGTSKPSQENGEFPYLRMNNLTYSGKLDLSDLKYIDANAEEVRKYSPEYGDILFNRTNSKELVGKTAVFSQRMKTIIAGYIIRVRTGDMPTSVYIAQFLNSRWGKAILQGMCKSIIGMANINAQELQDIPLPIPPQHFRNVFALRIKEIETLQEKHSKALRGDELLFSSLQHRAFAGEL